MKYIPSGDDDRKKMLNQMNVKSFEDLIKHIPENLKNRKSHIDKGISEYELMKQAKKIAAENRGTASMMSFMGCGVYDHYIPPAIRHIVLRPEFYTAYTPYQAEVSQGTLQVIYEFQSMISEMYGMDISNASMYDGSTATAEACHMAMDITRKKKIVLSDLIHPIIKEVINTYLTGQNIEYQFVKSKNGLLDMDDLRKKVDSETAAFVIQTPNFLGFIENMDEVSAIVKETKALFIVNQNPMSLGILKSPGSYNADIAIGEAQVLGISQAFGGPLLGIFTCKKEYARKMPGRIIGKTTDTKGRDGYVMTMQTREQHIRREKATSNICTNEGLNALAATVFL
ncbi:aminomethyl-transferring glycine dehydrogenase subunit GcvPA, partial [candidate division WOR-3 bacterium]|nr:aminomethyl-transferring glycine dehydrogenase subunit GcvPA [candidate division WOR-3 bacterium]